MSWAWAEPATHPDEVRRFVHEALERRAGDVYEVGPWVDQVLGELAAGTLKGTVPLSDRRPVGLVAWASGGPLGSNVHVLYLSGPAASPAGYAELLTEAARRSGGVAFAPGRLAGMATSDEAGLMERLGFGRYGRSEMKRSTVPGPEGPAADGPGVVRPIGPEDESALARLHRVAYHGRFDRYLFQEEADEERDSAREVHQLLHGRWGPLETNGSLVLELDGALVADVLAVERPQGVLIADVAVEPAHQGRRLGHRILRASLQGLATKPARAVYLNVTEGNTPAIRLYTSLGFVRSLGPSEDWYNRAAIPVVP